MKKLTSSKNISLKENEMLLLRGTAGIVAIVKIGPNGQFFLETENEEIVLGLESHVRYNFDSIL